MCFERSHFGSRTFQLDNRPLPWSLCVGVGVGRAGGPALQRLQAPACLPLACSVRLLLCAGCASLGSEGRGLACCVTAPAPWDEVFVPFLSRCCRIWGWARQHQRLPSLLICSAPAQLRGIRPQHPSSPRSRTDPHSQEAAVGTLGARVGVSEAAKLQASCTGSQKVPGTRTSLEPP